VCPAHQAVALVGAVVFPHGQAGQFPGGQFPPQLSAKAKTKTIIMTTNNFIFKEIINYCILFHKFK
jgi:hypothetical protein